MAYKTERKYENRTLEKLFESVPGGIIMYEWDGKRLKTLYISNYYKKQYGSSFVNDNGNINEPDFERVHPKDREAYKKAVVEAINGKQTLEYVYRTWNKEANRYLWTKINAISERQSDGTSLIYAMYSDVTEQKEAQILLENHRASLQILILCIKKLSSENNFEDTMNQVMKSIVSYYKADRSYIFEFAKNKKSILNTYESSDSKEPSENNNLKNISEEYIDKIINELKSNDYVFFDNVETLKDDPKHKNEYKLLIDKKIKNFMVVPIYYKNKIHGFLGIEKIKKNIHDYHFILNLNYFISNEMEKHNINARLKSMAYCDALTGAYNRRFFNERLYIDANKKYKSISFLMTDLTNFKEINDKYGHLVGDSILKSVSKELIDLVGEENYVIRFGGDEFLIIIADKSEDEIINITYEINNQLEKVRFGIQNEFRAILDIGYSFSTDFSASKQTIEQMVRNADALMYRNKIKENIRSQGLQSVKNTDMLTHFGNKIAFNDQVNSIKSFIGGNIGIMYVSINNVITNNMKFSKHKADELIVDAADIIESVFRKGDAFRIEKSRFVILAIGMPKDRFITKIKELEYEFERNRSLVVSIGSSWCNNSKEIDEYLKYAQREMIINKKKQMDIEKDLDILSTNVNTRQNILIIGNEDGFRAEMEELLNKEYNVTYAGSPSMIRYLTENYSMIVTSLNFKTKNIRDYYYELSKYVNMQDMPVVVISDIDKKAEKTTLYRYGVNFIFEKNEDREIVKASIDSILRLTNHQLFLHSSSFDRLTNLPNLTYFYEFSSKILKDKKNIQYTFVYFDILKFKMYNDIYGYEAGNEFLRDVGRIISQEFSGFMVSRLADDHFAVLIETSALDKKIENVYYRIFTKSQDAQVRIKAGVYEISKGETIALACDRAKLACDDIKEDYSAIYGEYDVVSRDKLIFEKYIIDHLEDAIKNKELFVYYQPIVRIKGKKICGMESLVRWNDPNKGFMAPDSFIPILEKNKLIHRLDEYMIENVCRDIRESIDSGIEAVPISLNLSRLDFDLCDIYKVVTEKLEKYKVPVNCIHVEITESVLNSDNIALKNTLMKFRRKGIEVWLDDFGSKYSTLNSLQNYEVDVLKIDMKFFDNFNTNVKTRIIISSVVDMAKKLGFKTLAEGIEDKAEYEFLQKIGCDKIQGYYFYRPMPLSEIKKLSGFETKSDKEKFEK